MKMTRNQFVQSGMKTSPGHAILLKSGIDAQTIPVLILEKLTQPLIWPNIHTWTGSRQKRSTSHKC